MIYIFLLICTSSTVLSSLKKKVTVCMYMSSPFLVKYGNVLHIQKYLNYINIICTNETSVLDLSHNE